MLVIRRGESPTPILQRALGINGLICLIHRVCLKKTERKKRNPLLRMPPRCLKSGAAFFSLSCHHTCSLVVSSSLYFSLSMCRLLSKLQHVAQEKSLPFQDLCSLCDLFCLSVWSHSDTVILLIEVSSVSLNILPSISCLDFKEGCWYLWGQTEGWERKGPQQVRSDRRRLVSRALWFITACCKAARQWKWLCCAVPLQVMRRSWTRCSESSVSSFSLSNFLCVHNFMCFYTGEGG